MYFSEFINDRYTDYKLSGKLVANHSAFLIRIKINRFSLINEVKLFILVKFKCSHIVPTLWSLKVERVIWRLRSTIKFDIIT